MRLHLLQKGAETYTRCGLDINKLWIAKQYRSMKRHKKLEIARDPGAPNVCLTCIKTLERNGEHEFGPRLAAWRARNKVSQREVAERVGSSACHISDVERHWGRPSIALLNRILAMMETGK